MDGRLHPRSFAKKVSQEGLDRIDDDDMGVVVTQVQVAAYGEDRACTGPDIVRPAEFAHKGLHAKPVVSRQHAQLSLEVRLPKHGSERTVEAADGLLSILSEHIALRGLQGQPDAWLFPGEGDLPAHRNRAGNAWRKGRASSGIRGELVLHDLRHYFASGLIEAGCLVATVQHALGHASPSITLNTYTHLWPTEEDPTRRAAQGLVDDVFRATDESVTNGGARSA